MTNEKIPPIIGVVLLVVGIVILMFTFFQTLTLIQGVGDYFREQFPDEGGEGPNAQFSWNSNGLDVSFQDESDEGDAQIRSWEWNFDDGSSSTNQNPQHTYDSSGNYRVRLRVEDANGESSSIDREIYFDENGGDPGETEGGGDEYGSGFGDFGLTMAAGLLVGILFLVMYLVGASLVKAGWNLLKPGPSTVKLKIKPKQLEVEQGAMYYPPQGGYGGPYTPPPAQKDSQKPEKKAGEPSIEDDYAYYEGKV
ncbi:MAG: PKD domain-containing protein [Methanomassiliicoccales archaeon]|nr:MAG: PKD domain-containing protein [Methanomassiliicoccales archaeon]